MKNYLIYEPAFARDYGSNAAILLSLFLFKYKYWFEKGELADDGSYFISTKDIEKQTGLKRRKRESGTKTLIDGGFIKVLSENGETFRLKININHVQNVHALIETMYKTYMLPCTKCTYTINKSINQSTNNAEHTLLEEEEKDIIDSGIDKKLTDSDILEIGKYKNVVITRAWSKKALEKYGDKDATISHYHKLDYYLENYPDQKDWALNRGLEKFLEYMERAIKMYGSSSDWKYPIDAYKPDL